MDIAKEIATRAADIEQRIQTYLPKVEGYQHTIFEAMAYSVTAGGKRLRPMLMEASYEMFGGTDPKLVEPFMAAIECIHTYSLVHDDLRLRLLRRHLSRRREMQKQRKLLKY